MQFDLQPKQPSLKLKTQPKQLSNSLTFAMELLNQGTLTEGEGSVQLTSLY
jgi:hypothetical protein